MQHNLEGIPFTEAVHENGSRYSDFRNQLTPRYGVVWFDIVKGYIFLAAAASISALCAASTPPSMGMEPQRAEGQAKR